MSRNLSSLMVRLSRQASLHLTEPDIDNSRFVATVEPRDVVFGGCEEPLGGMMSYFGNKQRLISALYQCIEGVSSSTLKTISIDSETVEL